MMAYRETSDPYRAELYDPRIKIESRGIHRFALEVIVIDAGSENSNGESTEDSMYSLICV